MPTKPQSLKLTTPHHKPHHRPCDQWRERSDKRGYDTVWKNLRNAFIEENPLCRHCEERGLMTLATEVDHIRPFQGINDPLRLNSENLQSLCHSCHVTKTYRDNTTGRS